MCAAHARRVRSACYFYGGGTRNGLAVTPAENAFDREQTLGHKTCVNIPPPSLDGQRTEFIQRPVLPYPVHPKVKIHKMAPWEQPPP